MNKNFIKFLTISLSLLAINSSIGYSTENISTDEINTNNNIINEHLQQNHNQIENNNYNSAELTKTTENIYNRCDNMDYYGQENITNKVRNYLNNISAFYNSKDINILPQLTNIVHSTINSNQDINIRRQLPNILNGTININYDELLKNCVLVNLKYWMDENIIAVYDCEALLIFNLFLNIMTNIEHTGEMAWPHKRLEQDSIYTTPITIDGKKWWVPEECSKGYPYKFLLTNYTQYLIMELTELLIPKYFVLDNPETWITRDKLTAEIKNYIQNMCNYFDSLPLVKQILKSKHIKSTYNSIPAVDMDQDISNRIDYYFGQQQVKKILQQKWDNYKRKKAMENVFFNNKFFNNKWIEPPEPPKYKKRVTGRRNPGNI